MPTVVGLGEVLWDLLPSGRQLGGAPANFAYWSHMLGNRAVVASRIGDDELGREVRERLLARGVTDQFLQTDQTNPTGTVNVHVDAAGQPRFEITYPVAWDFLEWTETWEWLARSADAVCFGSLAQRSPDSRKTILKFIDETRTEAVRILDVNLRQSFYSAETIRESVKRANVLKLNHEEVPRINDLLEISADDTFSFCEEMLPKFGLRLIAVTRGGNGSLLRDANRVHEHPGFQVDIKDTVGSGDAFTAGLVHEYLQGKSLAEINDSANRLGACVASCAGAMPQISSNELKHAMTELQMR